MRKFRHLIAPALAFIILAALDLVTKDLAERFLQDQKVVKVLGDFFVLVYARNEGAFLSFGSDFSDGSRTLLFIVLPVIALGLIVFSIVRRPRAGGDGGSVREFRAEGSPAYFEGKTAELWGAALLLAGGFGNLFDRIAYQGSVRDFMNFGLGDLSGGFRTGILNMADLYLTAALLVILGTSLLRKRRRDEEGT